MGQDPRLRNAVGETVVVESSHAVHVDHGLEGIPFDWEIPDENARVRGWAGSRDVDGVAGEALGGFGAVRRRDSPRGPSFEFTWGRTHGAIGVRKMQEDQKGPYDPLKIRSTRIYPSNSFLMISPTLPSGAFDMPTPPPWPTPNPRPQ
jgi:hypothetical protein